MITIKEGTFQMLRPIFSSRIKGWLIGGVVGSTKGGMAYTKRLPQTHDLFSRIATETEKIRMQIHRDHPGIVEERLMFGGKK